MKPFPRVTLAIVAAALAVHVIPALPAALVYDRSAVLEGQIWRLASAHFVHLSSSHLVLNLLVVAIAGCLIERERMPGYAELVALSAITIGVGVLLFAPVVSLYAGSSGIACALLVYLALDGLWLEPERRWLCLATLASVALKIVWEVRLEHPLFAMESAAQPFRPSPIAHLLGAAAGAAHFSMVRSGHCLSRTVHSMYTRLREPLRLSRLLGAGHPRRHRRAR